MFRPRLQVQNSKCLSEKLEKELRLLVFDAGEGPCDGNAPQLIIGNQDSYCHGVYYLTPEGVEFIFHHNKPTRRGPCTCFVKGGPNNAPFFQLPPEIDEYRVRLIEGNEPIQMEPLFAAMVAMKLFLGMELPDKLRGPFPKDTQGEAKLEQKATKE